MREELLLIWQCPLCHKKEVKIKIEEQKDEIWKGILICADCRQEYRIADGILETKPHLSAGLKEEIKSVRQKTNQNKDLVFPLSEQVELNDKWLLSLPSPYYHAGNWNPLNDIEFIIKKINLEENHWALDLGAGVCWTTRELAKVSKRCVAVDILDDKYLGLSSAKVYIDSNKRHFDRVNAMMEKLPFKNSSFDFVLTNCSAHHADSLPKLFQEIKRVLKPSGFYALSNELTQGIFKKSQLEGNDHYYTICDYLNNLKKAGFRPKLYFPPSIDEALKNQSFQRKSQKWKLIGQIVSRFYRISFFQNRLKRQTYLLSRLFGLPPIIISTI